MEESEQRRRLCEIAAGIVDEIGSRPGGFTMQDVLHLMDHRKLMRPEDYALDQRWASGVVSKKQFRDEFEEIGQRKQGNKARNVHPQRRTVWLRKVWK